MTATAGDKRAAEDAKAERPVEKKAKTGGKPKKEEDGKLTVGENGEVGLDTGANGNGDHQVDAEHPENSKDGDSAVKGGTATEEGSPKGNGNEEKDEPSDQAKGAFQSGTASNPQFDGTYLVQKSMRLVNADATCSCAAC